MRSRKYFEADGDKREAYLESLTPDELLDLGIELYDAAHYWNAHEAWEQVWLDAPDELRNFYQGLIQVTAAFVHVTRNEYPGSVRLLESGLEKLRPYEPAQFGVDVSRLLDEGDAALAALVGLGEKRLRDFDMTLVPHIVRDRT